MFHGKTKAALRLLTDKSTGYPLQLDDLIESGNSPPKKVRDILSGKHPGGLPADPDSIDSDEPPPVHPVIFDLKASLLSWPADSLHFARTLKFALSVLERQ